ncbi:hypothetical protein FHG87_016598 [Trinorchestia longiramus]|nr:hypothetical protein FHG87_016598 [Trinorchestia longiramus]
MVPNSEDLRPTPVSLAHEWLLFTRDERVALYEYALQHTQPPPTPPELVLQPGSVTEGDGKEEAVLRKHQRDLRRRRQAYRTAATGSKTLTEVTREVIRNIMELIGVPVDTPHKTDLCQTKSSYYNADPSNISVSSSSDPKNISTYKNLQTSEHRRHHKHISRRLKHRSTSHADDSACYRKRGDSSVLKRDKRKTEKRNKSYERAKK